MSQNSDEVIQLTAYNKRILNILGNGDISAGICMLVSKSVKKSNRSNNGLRITSPRRKYEEIIDRHDASHFISEYLTKTDNRGDRIKLADLYLEYIEYTYSNDKGSIGKVNFSRLLKQNGFRLVSGGQNIKWVIHTVSNWI